MEMTVRHFVFAGLLISVRLAGADSAAVPDFVPPATNSVMGFNLRAVLDSGVIQKLGADSLRKATAEWRASSGLPGVDPLQDIDEIVFAFTAGGSKTASLVICRGRFSVEEFGRGAERYRGMPVRQAPDKSVTALVDAGTLVGGTLAEVHAALDRRETHTGVWDTVLGRRAADLSGRYAIWGAGTLPEGFHPPSGKIEGLDSLDRFEFGIALHQGVQLQATLHVRTPEDAQKLNAMVQLFQMMAQAQPNNSGAKIETRSENDTITLSLALTEEALQKAIAQQRAVIEQALSQAAARKPPAATGPPAASGTKMVTDPKPPASTQTRVVTDDQGNSVQVTLPGSRGR